MAQPSKSDLPGSWLCEASPPTLIVMGYVLCPRPNNDRITTPTKVSIYIYIYEANVSRLVHCKKCDTASKKKHSALQAG